MSYLNRFIIEEDAQFECAGVMDNGFYRLQKSFELLKKSFSQFSNESNSDFIGHLVLSFDDSFANDVKFRALRERARKNFRVPEFPLIVTRIESKRLECVQKEKYEKLYNEGGQITYRLEKPFEAFNKPFIENSFEDKTLQVYKSIGDDIDDLYDRIHMKNIQLVLKNSRGILLVNREFDTEYDGFIQHLSYILESRDSVKTFHLSMLSDREERKMHSEIPFASPERRFVDFENDTILSKSGQNYALSLCVRKTFYCSLFVDRSCNRISSMHPIIEPDPWQERIFKNFEELSRKTRKRKAQELVLENISTDLESDSSYDFDSN